MTHMPNTREGILLACLAHGEHDRHWLLAQYRRRTGREMPIGSFYLTLDRMEQRGLVRSRMEDEAMGFGGKRRKCFTITSDGMRALDALSLALVGNRWRLAEAGRA